MHAVFGTKIANRWDKTRIINAMQRMSLGRNKTTNQLMLTLGAWVKIRQTLLDRELDTLIITQLKMQAIILTKRAPITTVKRCVFTLWLIV